MDKPDWILESATATATEAQPQLLAILEEAYYRHGGPQINLDQATTIRLGLILREIQEQSFNLGIQLGMKLLYKSTQGPTQ